VNVTTLVCSSCGTTAAPGSRFCEEDGTRLTAPAATRSPGCRCATPNDSEESGFCETCGLRVRVSQIQGLPVLGPDLAIATDVGKRHYRNEDAGAIGCDPKDGASWVLVVCDGVSSSSSSDRAAAIAAVTARAALLDAARSGPDAVAEAALAEAIQAAHRAVCEAKLPAEPGKDPPGATIVTAVARPGEVVVGWLGDSRAYWLSDQDANLLTHDDSWIVEQVDSGALSLEQASAAPSAHAITHCIGPLEGDGSEAVPAISPHTLRVSPSTAGTLILCSDGLWNYLADPESLVTLVRATPPEADAEVIATSLVQYALDAGGVDNVTVAVARLPQLDFDS